MRATKLLLVFLLGMITIIPFAFADVPQNDTVNISAYINSPPVIETVELEDFAPYDVDGDITLVAAGNKTVYCIINASDEDGYLNLNYSDLNVSIYNVGYSGAADPKYKYILPWSDTTNVNSCLNQTSGGGETSDGWTLFNCSVSMPYYTENGTWECYARIYDTASRQYYGNRTDNATLYTMLALNISVEEIDFQFFALGQNGTREDWNTTIENIGNVPLTVDMSATNTSDGSIVDTYAMNCNTSYINETDIYFNDAGAYDQIDSGNWMNLDSGWTSASNMALNEAAADNDPNRFYTIFWGLNLINSQSFVPQPKGSCRGWLFFDAVMS